jgi:carbon-monoxide dehydrogenase large subunit
MNPLFRFGKSQVRIEDQRLLTGRGIYIDDINLANQLYAVLLRSPYAHARITRLDSSAACSAPGVLLVLTGPEWVTAGHGAIPCRSPVRKNIDGTPFKEPQRHCLAVDTVRQVGEPVAFVVAETYVDARRALELIEIDFESLTPVTDQIAALQEGAPQLWPVAPGNCCIDYELGNRAAVEATFARADHVVRLSVINNRVTAAAMEPRGVVASYDASSDTYTLWNSSQNIHINRDIIAGTILKIKSDKLRHLAPDIGGGFGGKNSVYPEPALALYAAKRLGRPVKWIADRSEAFLTDTHGRDQVSDVSLALDKSGHFMALRVETIGNLGACCGTMGPFTPTLGTARTQGGPYAIPAMYYAAKAVFTNTSQTDPYRGAGRPEASFQIERIIEYAARTLGLDRIELRRMNLIQPDNLPGTSPMGLTIDSGNFPAVFERALTLADYAGFAARAAAARAVGLRRGFAIAPYLECSGGMTKEEARVQFEADGTVHLSVGSHSTGMGHETSMSQVLSQQLGIDIEHIKFAQADTAATAIGGGHGGSRSLEVGGNAVLKAANEIISKARAIAAHLLNSQPDDFTFADGMLRDIKTDQTLSILEVAAAASEHSRLPSGMAAGGLNTTVVFEREAITIPNGAHAAEVEVDPETGVVRVVGYWVVDDFGNVVNPMLADGQVMGGVAQGLGQALLEEIVHDPETGQLLTGSLMDYALPRADHMPRMVIEYYAGAPTVRNSLGVKGAGEAGCCGAPPAIVNAVLDALSEYGVLHLDMPLTPEKVWRAIEGSAAQTS